MTASSAAFATATDASSPGKDHFVVLDGLRGVAALMVVLFHLFEPYALGNPQVQIINHGYLAVDFFFLLSGFVIAYAYDDRWGRMGTLEFFKRRIVRLQPMVILGSVIGAALFALQASPVFPKMADASAMQVILVMVLGFLMIPLPKSGDVRGWDEIYPLNGPAWSLFYEYIANALYALGVRKLSHRALAVLVALSACALVYLLVFGPRGDVIGGWALDASGIQIGLTRVMFPFFAGVLMMRLRMKVRMPHAFAVASALLVVAISLPRFGGLDRLWLNGLYEAACIVLLFPLIVAIGAGDKAAGGVSIRIARFFGDLSFPLYITHYPLIYIYTAWVSDGQVTPVEGALSGAALLVAAVAIAYASLKLYDEPVRRWLAAKLLRRS
ncbi:MULTISPECIES: acyltransferase family protein [Sphingomonas]|uniref:Acyltransferase n=1 Tax=Sphingomonas molluscorum TaxID=418184 RepID=A0ABU8Q8W0_9SPHN|nr:acyltransferase [Sphingomonas sp. JUb134]MBM7407493.1 peptidoglycan/LPS O-acetylase OafA/YrhL [Sphingomonas sp. JUb134]